MTQKRNSETAPQRAKRAPVDGHVPVKNRGGRDQATTPAERQHIALLRAGGASHREIARQTGRSRPTVALALSSEDVIRLKDQARGVLDRNMAGFADDLITASRVGAARGRHEPCYDVLTALRVIDKPQSAPQNAVIVNIGVVGLSAPGLAEIHVLPDPRRPDTDSGP